MNNIFYHATDVEFDKFDPELMATKGSLNGHLGIWTAYEVEECELFGNIIMKLEVPEVKAYELSIRDLLKINSQCSGNHDKDREFYKSLAKTLMNKGYNVIRLMEINGVSVQAILLDYENVKIIEHFSSPIEHSTPWGR